jgi:peroxiredoxin
MFKFKNLIHTFVSALFVLSMIPGMVLTSCQTSDVDPVPAQNNANNNTGNNTNNNSNNNTNTGGNNSVGEMAPGFTLLSTYGDSVSLSDYKDRVIVLFFLGNTCPSCISVAPSVEKQLSSAYDNNPNYKILGLDQWDGNKTSLEAFRETTHVTFPLLLNASGVALKYETTYDRLVVVDKEGNIAFDGHSSVYNDLDAVKELVDSLLGN